MASKELPEVWKRRHQAFIERADGAYVYYDIMANPYRRWIPVLGSRKRGSYGTARAAINALDRECPMKEDPDHD